MRTTDSKVIATRGSSSCKKLTDSLRHLLQRESMIVFVNGEFLPEEQATISVFDRGFLYGDGLFETLLVANGKPFRWEQHLLRLQRGAAYLRISLPYKPEDLRQFVSQLVTQNQMPHALLRLTLSRGIGVRGYSPRGAIKPAFTMTLHPAPPPGPNPPAQWRLMTSSLRLPAGEPLAQFKTCNKLPQILARAEADASGADEALLLNTNGEIVEASSGNLFWIDRGAIATPSLASGILPGVTREVVFELGNSLGITVQQSAISPQELAKVEGVFLSLSSMGIVEAITLDNTPLAASPLVVRLGRAYQELVRNETQTAWQ